MKPFLALLDCNNFFVSCERLFRPDLTCRPVVVLSSNDGCVVSRSDEAKALGIPMGAPLFQYRRFFREHEVVQFSGNFELYGDISQRITRLLSSITPQIEVYSVDESFLDLSQLNISDYNAWGRAVRGRLLQEVGIPVSIGLATTKTLAKLGTEVAKRDPRSGGVLDLANLSPPERETHLARMPVGDVWGVGRRLSPQLRAEGVYTALDLSRMRARLAQQLFGIHGRQMVCELNGIRCHQLEPFGRVRQSVMHGRQFGEDTSQFAVIEAAVANLTARAAARLRTEQLLARTAVVYLDTNRHKPGYRRLQCTAGFDVPTADTGIIASRLVEALEAAFNPHLGYHKANVLLCDLVSEQALQTNLFGRGASASAGRDDSLSRLRAIDTINGRYGPRTVHYASEDLSAAWRPKRQSRSPHYTTCWEELPVIG